MSVTPDTWAREWLLEGEQLESLYVCLWPEADIENLPDKHLRELSKVGGKLDMNLERPRSIVLPDRAY